MTGNEIHPSAFIGADVVLGVGNTIGPYAVITGRTRIGNDNWIGPSVAIGTPGQSRSHVHRSDWLTSTSADGDPELVIADGNVIREFATIHAGTVGPTIVGSRCYLMTQSHVPHDALLEDDVTVANAVQIGGHTFIGRGATLGLAAVLHQRSIIGAGAMVGMSAVVVRPVQPYVTAVGSPARARGINAVGLQRAGFSEADIAAVEAYQATPDGETGNALPALLRADFARYEALVAEQH